MTVSAVDLSKRKNFNFNCPLVKYIDNDLLDSQEVWQIVDDEHSEVEWESDLGLNQETREVYEGLFVVTIRQPPNSIKPGWSFRVDFTTVDPTKVDFNQWRNKVEFSAHLTGKDEKHEDHESILDEIGLKQIKRTSNG